MVPNFVFDSFCLGICLTLLYWVMPSMPHGWSLSNGLQALMEGGVRTYNPRSSFQEGPAPTLGCSQAPALWLAF